MNQWFIWVAVTKEGGYRVFKQKPRRDTIHDVWVGDFDGDMMAVLARMETKGFKLPTLTWNDEPVRIKMTMGYGEEE